MHKKFPQEMAKRTVINRAAKAFINTSDDSDLLVDAINRSTENEYEGERKEINPEHGVQKEIEQNANQEVIDVNTSATLKRQPEIIDAPKVNEKVHQKLAQDRALAAPN